MALEKRHSFNWPLAVERSPLCGTSLSKWIPTTPWKKSFLKENENKEVIEFQWKKVLYRFALLNSSISVTIAGKVRLVQCKNETCV